MPTPPATPSSATSSSAVAAFPQPLAFVLADDESRGRLLETMAQQGVSAAARSCGISLVELMQARAGDASLAAELAAAEEALAHRLVEDALALSVDPQVPQRERLTLLKQLLRQRPPVSWKQTRATGPAATSPSGRSSAPTHKTPAERVEDGGHSPQLVAFEHEALRGAGAEVDGSAHRNANEPRDDVSIRESQTASTAAGSSPNERGGPSSQTPGRPGSGAFRSGKLVCENRSRQEPPRDVLSCDDATCNDATCNDATCDDATCDDAARDRTRLPRRGGGVARNARCPCRSGRKFKRCCGMSETGCPSAVQNVPAAQNATNAQSTSAAPTAVGSSPSSGA